MFHAVYKHYSTVTHIYMYNEHTVMYMHILKLQDHNRSEYSCTSNVSGLDSHKEIG